jgi:hypothetical protein
MTNLILPSHVASALAYERAREEFKATLFETGQRMAAIAREYNALLARIDPKLQLIYWDSDRPDMPLRKGYWYVIRDNPGAPPTWMEVNINGAPCEPNSRLFDKLAEGDLWNTDLIRRSLRAQRERLAQAQADRLRVDEERMEHIHELTLAATRTQVSMNRDTPWTQNNSANSRRARAEKAKKERP